MKWKIDIENLRRECQYVRANDRRTRTQIEHILFCFVLLFNIKISTTTATKYRYTLTKGFVLPCTVTTLAIWITESSCASGKKPCLRGEDIMMMMNEMSDLDVFTFQHIRYRMIKSKIDRLKKINWFQTPIDHTLKKKNYRY